jgi:hypothetical protein
MLRDPFRWPPHVEQRADGDERDLAWMLANLLEQKLNRLSAFAIRLLARVGGLTKNVGVRSRNPGSNGNVRAADGGQITVDQPRPQPGVTIRRCDA